MMAIVAQDAKEAGTKSRLEALRRAMTALKLDAYLIPSVDEHINEYLPENKQRRAWLSGFTGSAGDCLVGLNEAWVFADSRYHEQADYEVALSLINVSKLGLEGQPGLTEKIRDLAKDKSSFRLGFDPFTLSVQQYQAFKHAFDQSGIELVPVGQNLIDPLWSDAPAAVKSEVYPVPESVSGKSWQQKLTDVRERMQAHKADILTVTKLDQIAWLFNLRGQDIPYNPVFMAYAIISADHAALFVDASRFKAGLADSFAGQVELQPYENYAGVLKQLAHDKTVLLDPKHTTTGTLNLIHEAGGRVKEADHPVELMKSVKNETEIRMMQEANLKASRGKIRAWYWLEQQIAAGVTVTEVTFKDAIERFYAEEEGFMGLSFNTISGAGANSSIVHYGTPDPDKTLEKGELFLIDSGCQYWGGTTDDTRTMLVGETATDLQKLRFTEVLKAHINCAMQRFPKGTEGARLDGVTRFTLWENGLDYGHGTGHGVGAFLNVHEGPNGIHKLASKPLEANSINSIEPGFYEPGWGGIRLENLYRVVTIEKDKQGTQWMGFESLTYVPFDPKLTDFSRLDERQRQWLNAYNAAIVAKIAPTLPADEAAWLKEVCKPV